MRKIIASLLLLLSVNAWAQNKTQPTQQETFSQYVMSLPSASAPLSGTEQVMIVQGGNARQTTTGSFAGATSISAVNVTFSSNITFLSSGWSSNQTWINVNGNSLSGQLGSSSGAPGGSFAPFSIYVGNDTVNTTTTGPGYLSILSVLDGVSANSSGGRLAIAGEIAVVGTPASVSSAGYVGLAGTVRCDANLTGTTGAYTNYSGGCFGGNSFAWAQAAATFVALLNSWEFDTAAYSGSSIAEKHGLTIVKVGSDAVQATYDDSALEFNDQDSTSTTWNYGISFGAYAHKWPFSSSSTLIGVQNRVAPSSASSPANIGVDMTNGTFTTAEYKGTGFLVDPSGNVTGHTFILGSAGSDTVMAIQNPANSKSGIYFPDQYTTRISSNGTDAFAYGFGGLSTALVTLNVVGSSLTTISGSASIGGSATNGGLYSGEGSSFDVTVETHGGTAVLQVTSGGVVSFPNVGTGTPHTYACFDSSLNLISSSTAC
jgi:hypothetical protein